MRLKLNESLILSSLLSMAASSLLYDMKQLKSQMIGGGGRIWQMYIYKQNMLKITSCVNLNSELLE